MANQKSTENDDRARLWCALVYPDSAPDNWRDLLDMHHFQWAESPLHEFDVNPGTGETKKPHWHIILSFEGKKSYKQICDILKPVGAPIPERCHSLVGAVRYLVHLDNPEKYQYPQSGIIGHGGFDVQTALVPTSAKRYELIREMVQFIKEKHIDEFQDLMDYACAERFDDWFPLLCDNSAYIVGQYIKSVRHRTIK